MSPDRLNRIRGGCPAWSLFGMTFAGFFSPAAVKGGRGSDEMKLTADQEPPPGADRLAGS